jgi:hypothetical protein
VSQATPHPPQFDAVVICVSQPLVFGGVVLQSFQPAAQPLYLQVAPLEVSQTAPVLCEVSQDWPQALHVAAATDFSQPSRSGAVVSQSAKPLLQPV